MILAIDVGNTHIVYGMIEAGEIRNIVRVHTDPRSTATEHAIQLRQMHRYARLTGFPWEDMIREFHDQDRLPVPGRKEGKDVLACIRTRLYTQTV